MKLDIAIGKFRDAKTWRNVSMGWPELTAKCGNTHITAETVKEYFAAPKKRQDEIKDVGGFVGGYLEGGRRKKDTVQHRQLITLDADHSPKELWEDFQLLYSCAALCYSTHKHTPDNPRLRLVIPMSRPVTSAEYEPICRRITQALGIEQFDITTYQVHRLMYWPSTSKDGEFFFDQQDGEWLDPDTILATYRNWQDASEWPVGETETKAIQHGIKKQGDPLEKEGIVGAFCRVYSIHDAIETFLTEEYETCDVEDRYTYKEGSTAAGLITYDDKFAFSHHGTDPTSGKLCNAFDLVRIHKFGIRDEDAQLDTPSNRLPSYLAMVDFASKDAPVKKQIGVEKMQEAGRDFGDYEEGEQEPNLDWIGEMDVDKKGNFHSTIKNVTLILNNDPKLKGRMAMDEFEKREVALKDLPWRKVDKLTKYLTDVDDANLRDYIESNYGISSGPKIKDGEDIILSRNGFNPVKDYLNSLSWDGRARIDTLLCEYLGADDTPYIRAIMRKTLTAAVARIYEPGIKFDYVLTFVGEEGLKKSSFIAALGGEWFSDSFGDIDKKKEAMEQIQGVWLVEIGEMAAMNKASVEAVKQFISKRTDRFRVAYGHRVENFARQCIFIATTNNSEPLREASGNRRFWIAPVNKEGITKDPFKDLDEFERRQIWAEAIHYYQQGEPLYLSEELEAVAREMQSDHSEKDPREERIQWYLDKLLPTNWDSMNTFMRRQFLISEGDDLQPNGTIKRTKVCAAEIWVEAFDGNPKDMNAHNTRFIKNYMQRKAEGWQQYKSSTNFGSYGQQRGYFKTYKGFENYTNTDEKTYKGQKLKHTNAYEEHT